MKALFFSLVVLAGSLSLQAQTKIELADVSKHVGDSVLVKGKVFGLKAVNNGQRLLINVGGSYPNQLLTIVLHEHVQQVLAEALKAELQEISVAGKVELFKEKPQITVKDPAQLHSLVTEKAGTKE